MDTLTRQINNYFELKQQEPLRPLPGWMIILMQELGTDNYEELE